MSQQRKTRRGYGEGSHHEHPHNYRFDIIDRLVRFFVEPEFEGCEPLIQATQP
jgi:hypothetical protein